MTSNNLNKKTIIYWVIFTLLLLFLIIIQYYGLLKYHYLVPPGDDPYSHYLMAKPFFDGTQNFSELWKSGGYPPLYHYTIAQLAKFFHADIIQVMNWTYPSIIILASISIFACAYFLFGPWQALVSFFLYAFTGSSNVQLLFDGGFPNLIAAQVLLPLFVLFFIKLFLSKETKKQIVFFMLSLFLAILIALTHHISTFYLFGIIGPSLPLVLIWKWITQKWPPKKGFFITVFLLLIYCLAFYTFFKTDLLAPIRSLYAYSSSNFDSNGIWNIRHYPKGIGKSIFYFGVIGLMILAFRLILEYKNKSNITILILGIWALLLLAGSRIHMANPERLARDLIVPLAICSGLSIVVLFKLFKNNYYKIALIVLVFLFSVSSFRGRITRAFQYESMIRHTSADEQAIDYLKDKPVGSILTNEANGYLPLFWKKGSVGYANGKVIEPAIASQYTYLLLVEKQSGWVPDSTYIGIYKNMNDLPFKQIATFSSESRTAILFKNTLP